MKKWLQISIITLLLGWPLTPALAEDIVISQLAVTDFYNHSAKLKWTTNQETRGVVYFGPKENELKYQLNYIGYSYNHETTLTGLEEKTRYFYKIIAVNSSGEAVETFVQNFETGEIKDTISPKFEYIKLIQTTQDAVALSWQSNEETKATIYYGIGTGNFDKSRGAGGFSTEKEFNLGGLKPYAKYSLKIKIEDKDGNTLTSIPLEFRTGGDLNGKSEFKIYDVKPTDYEDDLLLADQATIRFKTNLASSSYIRYGTQSKKYSSKVDITLTPRDTQHEVTLRGLAPNTTYYFEIKAYNNIYGKVVVSQEYTFTTLPKQRKIVLGTKLTESSEDSDQDGLSDQYELAIGTNPFDNDSDHDGYPDATEIRHGYDPKGPGRLTKLIYGQPRLSHDQEMSLSIELKSGLEKKLGCLNLSRNDWFTVVNAYIYGGYPIDAIYQAIKWGGKTVHPTIPWSIWKNSSDYQNYINR